MKAISGYGIIHGDIKPDNILYSRTGNDIQIVISDFSFANGRFGGTPMFMAPEGLTNRVLEKTDIYSFGITILLLRYGPDVIIGGLFESVMSENLELIRNIFMSKPTISLVSQMIQYDPVSRPNLEIIQKTMKSNK